MSLVCCTTGCTNDDCVQLTERESSVCRAICSSGSPVSFGTLKASTSLHQEVLSRILKRLMVHGLVEKSEAGYMSECGQ